MATFLKDKKDIELLRQAYFRTFLSEDDIKEALINFAKKTEVAHSYIGLILKEM